jgi:branched-chain amino acid transport system substrate-binding protein
MSAKIRTVVPFAITLVIVLSIVLGGCAPTPAPAPEEKEPIIIGAVFNATGWMADYDQPPRSAALLKIDEVNAAGGVLGRELKLIELDGKSDPATVGNAALQLIDQGADVIIAPCDFDIGAPASQAAQEAGLVGISTCASSPLYGSEALGDKQFTAVMWNNIMSAGAAEYAYKELGWRTAYAVTDTTIDYSLSLSRYFIEHFEALGGKVFGEDTFLNEDQDFSAQIQRFQALSEAPDGLFISSYMPGVGTIVRQVRAAGIETPIMGGDAYDTTEFFELLGPDLGNNIYFATHGFLGPEAGEGMASFIKAYEEEYGEPPETSFILPGWDTVKVLVEAIAEAGTTDGAALAKAMEEMEFDLLTGKLDWTSAEEGHQPLKEVAIVEVQGAKPSFAGWIAPESPPAP